jgi:putative ABC transport system substrate-binding protein
MKFCRIVLLVALALGVLLTPLVADAQQAKKVNRIGILLTAAPELPLTRALLDAFKNGLRELGYVEGRNIIIEYRSAQGRVEGFSELAAELVSLKVDLIFVGNTPAARAAKEATSTVPIVAAAMGDPVGDGLIASLARPGSNVTG